MNYTIDDINFEDISFTEFENLCYDLLVRYNYSNVIWRKGGADNGRDIQANTTLKNEIIEKQLKWFFECKHYKSGGVPPTELNSKIAWADSEQPDFLVIFVSSYLTTPCRQWLEGIKKQKSYTIEVIEGDKLKAMIANYPELIERYFVNEKYSKLLLNVKDFKLKFKIYPSYDFLHEIMNNINLEKLDHNDFAFLLLNFYEQYDFFIDQSGSLIDFDKSITSKLFDQLALTCKKSKLKSFKEYKNHYDALGGVGFVDDVIYENEDLEKNKLNFQFYTLHLNYNKNKESWKIGRYLFYIHKDKAFEIFESPDIEIRMIEKFRYNKMSGLAVVSDYSKDGGIQDYLENTLKLK